jgi:disulfide bond formation protein DsbB
MSVLDPLLKRWPLAAAVVSLAVLGIAHAFQTFGGLAPCHLCLEQREVYWTALPIGVAAAIGLLTPYAAASRKVGGALLALTFVYGAYLAGFHAGAEWKWWPAPETCATPRPASPGCWR